MQRVTFETLYIQYIRVKNIFITGVSLCMGGNLCTSSGYPEDTAAMVEYSIQACAGTLRYTQGSRQQRKVKDESKH